MKEHPHSKIKKLIALFKREAWKAKPDPHILERIEKQILQVRQATNGRGWKLESARHSLASKGIKTGRK